jgi:hypothetical protein
MSLITNLEAICAKRDALTAERDEQKKRVATLEAEEKVLLANSDLEDKKQWQKVCEVRRLREILPRKIDSLSESILECETELKEECSVVNGALFGLIQEKKAALQRELAKAISPFFSLRSAEIRAAASTLLPNTNFGLAVEELEDRLRRFVILDRPLFAAVRELLAIAPGIGDLAIYCDPPSSRPHLKSADELERVEFAELSTDPAEAIEVRMKYMPREAAEKAVAERLKYLRHKFDPAASLQEATVAATGQPLNQETT